MSKSKERTGQEILSQLSSLGDRELVLDAWRELDESEQQAVLALLVSDGDEVAGVERLDRSEFAFPCDINTQLFALLGPEGSFNVDGEKDLAAGDPYASDWDANSNLEPHLIHLKNLEWQYSKPERKKRRVNGRV